MTQIIEWLRRLSAVALLLTGVWYVIVPGPEMLVVELQNFEKKFKNYPYYRSKDTSLEEFKQKQLQDRTYEVDPNEWQAVLESVKSGRLGQANQIYRNNHIYWLRDIPQFQEDWPDFLYIHPRGTQEYYSLSRSHPLDIYGIDRSKVYPHRTLGLWLILAAFLIYFMIPREKRIPERIYYGRYASVVIPDLMGLIGAAFFFALPILIVANNDPGSMPWTLEGGWWVVTAVLWFMAALFLSMIFIANHYSTLWLQITPSALLVNRGSTTAAYPWSDMESCAPYVGTMGRKLGILLILFGRTPGQVGQGLLVATNEAFGVEISLRNQKPLRVMANHLPDFPKILEALDSHQIKGIGDVAKG